MFQYKMHGTCSQSVSFEVDENNCLRNVRFIGGCRGNTQGVAKLCEGRNVDEVISCLQGIQCRGNTSCPDQLSKALIAYKNQ